MSALALCTLSNNNLIYSEKRVKTGQQEPLSALKFISSLLRIFHVKSMKSVLT